MRNNAAEDNTNLLTQPLISARSSWILAGLLAALLVVGSIWDYQISLSLYDPESVFGMIGAAFGELPSFLALLCSGTLLAVFRNKDRTGIAVLQLLGGAVLYILAVVSVLVLPQDYLTWPSAVTVVVGVVITGAATYGILWLARGAARGTAIKVAVALFLVPIIEVILVNIVKLAWERPRMRLLSETPGLEFSSWWQVGTPERAALLQSGVDSNEFMSFPSGHTANAAVLIMLTLLPLLRPVLSKWSGWFLWVGAAWGALVGLSRIIMGAHFLTDTTAGFTITFVVILVTYRTTFGPEAISGVGPRRVDQPDSVKH